MKTLDRILPYLSREQHYTGHPRWRRTPQWVFDLLGILLLLAIIKVVIESLIK
jgi:hypothetical protein